MSLVDAVVVSVELLEDGVIGHEDRPPLPQTHCPAHLRGRGRFNALEINDTVDYRVRVIIFPGCNSIDI